MFVKRMRWLISSLWQDTATLGVISVMVSTHVCGTCSQSSNLWSPTKIKSKDGLIGKMTVKEHDLINFSMNADVGAHRYYDKEVLRKDGNLIVNIDGNDVPLNKLYHIEIVGTTRIYIEPPDEEKGMTETEIIIKGLKCCTRDGCKRCPFRKYKCTCQIDLKHSALSYILESQEKINEIYLWLKDKDERGMTEPFNRAILQQFKERFMETE